MNGYVLLNAIGYLDDDLVERSEKKQNLFRRNILAVAAFAACLCLVLAGAMNYVFPPESDESVSEDCVSDAADAMESVSDTANNSGVKEKIDYGTVSIACGGEIANAEYPYVELLCSQEELETYLADYQGSLAETEFYTTIQKYDTEYFQNNQLIIVALEEVSSLVHHEVKNVYMEDDQLVISIIRESVPEYTDDLVCWHIFVEIAQGIIVSAEQIRVVI